MSHATIYLLFISSIGLALCSPLSQENCSEHVVELEATEAGQGIGEVNGNTNTPLISTTNVQEDNSSPRSSESQGHKPQNLPDTINEFRHISNHVIPAYQSDTSENLNSMGVQVSHSGGVLYPHVHPKLFAMYNAGYNVNYLPPVYSTYIHGLVPEEDLQKANYELDVLNSQNALFKPEQIRLARMIHSQDEEILAELQHDAIMNNILPTMPVPAARYAMVPASPSATSSYGSANGAPAIAVFPYGAGGGCAQPILLSCKPLPTDNAIDNSQVSAYRQPVDHNSKSADNKQNSPGKVNLSKLLHKS